MAIDDQTTNLLLTKPNAANQLVEDVARIRSAMDTIDAAIASNQTALDTGDDGLASLSDTVAALLSVIEYHELGMSANSSTFTYNADGQVANITETLPGGKARNTVFTYNADGTVQRSDVTVNGSIYTTTYTYVNGVVSSLSRVKS